MGKLVTKKDVSVNSIHLCFRAINQRLISSLEFCFTHSPYCDVAYGNILNSEADAIVSPGNSSGSMGGGIDLLYRNYFGKDSI